MFHQILLDRVTLGHQELCPLMPQQLVSAKRGRRTELLSPSVPSSSRILRRQPLRFAVLAGHKERAASLLAHDNDAPLSANLA